MSDLMARFEKASQDVQNLPDRPANDVLLELYALFKQGKEGDCQGKRPGLLSPVKRAKYDAWAKLAGLAQEEAQQRYVDLVQKLESGS